MITAPVTAKVRRMIQRKSRRALSLAVCGAVLRICADAREPRIITFDAPGAGVAAGQGTTALVINPRGVIAGFYADANNLAHGFVRAVDGSFATFEVPGAGAGPYQGTFLGGGDCLNPAGAVASGQHKRRIAYRALVERAGLRSRLHSSISK